MFCSSHLLSFLNPVCVCVCVWERERERETDRQRQRERRCVCIFGIFYVCIYVYILYVYYVYILCVYLCVYFMCVFMCIFMCIFYVCIWCCVSRCICAEAKREHRIPWDWSDRQLWAAHGSGNDLGLLQEQSVLLTAEPSLLFLYIESCYSSARPWMCSNPFTSSPQCWSVAWRRMAP